MEASLPKEKQPEKEQIKVTDKRIFTPEGEILKNGSAREWWAGELPADGSYRINVYTNKSAAPFKIRFTRTR